jgi:hypothetical protein
LWLIGLVFPAIPCMSHFIHRSPILPRSDSTSAVDSERQRLAPRLADLSTHRRTDLFTLPPQHRQDER